MNLRGRILGALLVLGAAATAARADADLSTPEGALHAFLVAQATFDAAGLKASTYNIEPELIDGMCESMAIARQTDQLAETTFGGSGKPLPTPALKPLDQLAAQADQDWQSFTKIPVRQSGDSAKLIDARGRGFTFRRIDGQWKVNGDVMFHNPIPENKNRDRIVYKLVIPIRRKINQEISDGKFRDWPSVERTMKQRIAAALAASPEYQQADKALADVQQRRADQLPQAPGSNRPPATPQNPQREAAPIAGSYDATVNAIRTALVGGHGGGEFERHNEAGNGPVCGFRYTFGNWKNRKCLSSWDPIFDPTAKPERIDPRKGGAILARPGYAVGAMLVDSDNTNAIAIRVTFMRLTGDRLDPKQSYTSDWIGIPSRIHQEQIGTSAGEPVVGTFGRKGLNVDAIGLLLASNIRRTPIIGGPGGGPFSSPVTGSPVVGFRFAPGEWGGRRVLRILDPIFASPPQDPSENAEQSQTIRAREGYARSGLLADTDGVNVCAVRATFVRLRDGKIDPADTYQSDWIGVPSNITQEKLGNETGRIVLGTYGRRGINMDAMGLLLGAPTSSPTIGPSR